MSAQRPSRRLPPKTAGFSCLLDPTLQRGTRTLRSQLPRPDGRRFFLVASPGSVRKVRKSSSRSLAARTGSASPPAASLGRTCVLVSHDTDRQSHGEEDRHDPQPGYAQSAFPSRPSYRQPFLHRYMDSQDATDEFASFERESTDRESTRFLRGHWKRQLCRCDSGLKIGAGAQGRPLDADVWQRSPRCGT